MEHLCEVVCGVDHLCEVGCGVVGRGHICTKNIMKVEGRWNTISHK